MNVTVVMPSLPERADMRERALASIAEQDCGPVPTLVILGHEPWAARNIGLQAVFTEWVAFLDDDDGLYPNHISTLIEAQEASGADVVYPDAEWFRHGSDGLTIGRRPTGPFDPERLRHENYIPVTYLMRSALARSVGGFPPRDERPSDWLFLLRLLDAGATFHHVPVVTWSWRRHEGNSWSFKETA